MVAMSVHTSVYSQNQPEEKLSMTFYALRNLYVDSVYISPLVEQQMMILMQCLDPHSEYLTAEQARANEDILLGPSASGQIGSVMDTSKARMLDKNIGYISIGVFVQSTIDEFHQKTDSLRKKGMKSLVLDIRDNPGGFFDSALGMADEFLPIGSLLVKTEGKHQPLNEVKAQVNGIWEKGKVVVLVNEQTMSAAEIFAGALQDWDRAIIIGRRTFGKGLIQETLPFSDGSAIRLSVARYSTPSGRSIQKPYKGRSRDAYFNEVSQRSATGALPAEAREKAYETLTYHRTIYGGGGIAPDLFVASDSDMIDKAVEILHNNSLYKRLLTTTSTATWTSFMPSKGTMHVSGTLPDHSYDNRSVVLEHHHPIYYDQVTSLGSATVTNRQFKMDIAIPDSLLRTLGTLRMAETSPTDLPSTFGIQMILTPGSVKTVIDSTGVALSGESLNKSFSDAVLNAERQRRISQFALNGQYNKLQSTRGLTSEEEADRQHRQQALNTQFMTVYANYLREHISQPFASELFFHYPISMYSAQDSTFLTGRCDQRLLGQMNKREEARKQRRNYFQQSVKATGIGAHYREIIAESPDGKPLKLTDLVRPGHVTLLDFWASWCIPCQQEIPFLKKLYEKYHKDGFDIVSISLDKSKSAWLKALERNGMPWPQISDLKAWDGPVTQDYGIQAIPFVLLLDKQGNIVLKNLHDQLLETAIQQALR